MDNKRDSEHIIVDDVKLKCNGVLHRFTNRAGAPYSAIYCGDYECFYCLRKDEEKMIKYWNESQGEKRMSELLPCPFCGGRAETMTSTALWTVRCVDCLTMIGIYQTEEQAVERWNTRYKESTVYDREETIEGCTVQVLTNTATGETSVGWWRTRPEAERDQR